MLEDRQFNDCVTISEHDDLITARLPLPSDYRKKLPDNSRMAKGRLKKELRKLRGLSVSSGQVIQTWRKYRTRGFVKTYDELSRLEKAMVDREDKQHYFSCSIAFKSDSLSSKARICMDASASTQNQSLNQLLPTGTITYDLPKNIQCFLTYPSVSIGDVTCFYNSFFLPPDQLHCQNFFWREDLDPEKEPERFFLVTLFYGLACISRLCILALNLLNETYPDLPNLDEKFYVDDLCIRTKNPQQTMKDKENIVEKLQKHGLRFKGFATSGTAPDAEVAEDERIGYLGLQWESLNDSFKIKIPTIHKNKKLKGQTEKLEYFRGSNVQELMQFFDNGMSLRLLVSKTMSYFDATGLLSPLLGNLRYMVRIGHQQASGVWDDNLPEETFRQFCQQLININEIKDHEYKRNQHGIELQEEENFQIVLFSDASFQAKQNVCYTRVKHQDGKYTVNFLSARNFLSRTLETIPKCEIDSLNRGCQALQAQSRNLHPCTTEVLAFADNTATIGWVLNDESMLQPYHRVRVSNIRKTLEKEDGTMNLYHVISSENISDLGTRPGKVSAADIGPNSVFFNGPRFLQSDLKEAEEEGIITHSSKLGRKAKKNRDYNDGLLFKAGNLLDEVTEIHEEMGMLEDHLRSTPTTLIARGKGITKTQELYSSAPYCFNPLRLPFTKNVTMMMVVFKFIQNTLRRCKNNAEIHGNTRNYSKILENFEENILKNMAFGNFFDTCFMTTNPPSPPSSSHAPSSSATSPQTSHASSSSSSPTISYQCISKCAKTQKQEQRTALREIQAFLGRTSKQKNQPKNKTWRLYPGVLNCFSQLKELNQLVSKSPSDLKIMDLILMGSIIINVSKFVESCLKHPFTKEIASTIGGSLYDTTNKIDKHLLEKIRSAIQEMQKDPTTFLHNDAPLAIFQSVTWMKNINFITNPLKRKHSKDPEKEVEPYNSRSLLSEIIRSQYEAARLKMLVFNYFHVLLSSEIKKTWSKEKIERHCKEMNGKFVSSWRVRVGFETVDTLVEDLEDFGVKAKKISHEFPPLVPVGDPDSPLIINICLHLHYDYSFNPLQRPKSRHHRGIHLNKAFLFKSVYVPGALSRIKKINEDCIMCKVRMQKYYRSIIGPLPAAILTNNTPFVHTTFDASGPWKLKALRGDRESRNFKHTKMYVMIFVCLSTRLSHMELCEDLTASSLANCITRLSCQHQPPVLLYADRHSSNITVLENMELHVKTNQILLKHHRVRYTLAPTGVHHTQGTAESRVKMLNRMMGGLNLEQNPLSILDLQTMLLAMTELLNDTPLGCSLGDNSSQLQVVTPAKLGGKLSSRSLVKPISVPSDTSKIMRDQEERWIRIMKIYNSEVIPALLKNVKWFGEENGGLDEGSLVMFEKRLANFSPKWSLAHIKTLIKSKDGFARRAVLEYSGSTDGEEPDIVGTKMTKKKLKETERDTLDLILLEPVCASLDSDRQLLHESLLELEMSELKARTRNSYPVQIKDPSTEETIQCPNCKIYKTQDCRLCQTLVTVSKRDHSELYISDVGHVTLESTKENIGEFKRKLQACKLKLQSSSPEDIIKRIVILATRHEVRCTIQEIDIGKDPTCTKVTIKIDNHHFVIDVTEEPRIDLSTSPSSKDIKLGQMTKRKRVDKLLDDLYSRQMSEEESTPAWPTLSVPEEEITVNVKPGCTSYCCCAEHCRLVH